MANRIRLTNLLTKRCRFHVQGRLVFILLTLVGLFTTASLHAGMAAAFSKAHGDIEAWTYKAVPIELSASPRPPVSTSSPNPADLLQRGKDFYQAGQFSAAVTIWQQTAKTCEAEGDKLNQAIALSYLASAFEQLGQWTPANAAIAQAIALLHSPNLELKPDTAQILAQALNIQGILQLNQGQASEALETWQRAETTYRRANDTVGLLGSQMNQARALQALGFYRRATALLEQVEQSLQIQPDLSLKVAGLQKLGNILRLVGNLNQSRTILQQSLTLAEKLREEKLMRPEESAVDTSSILLDLGNTARAQGETDTALTFYRQAVATALPTAKIQAQIVELSLLVQVERWAEAQTLWSQIQPQLAELPSSHPGIYARIHLAQALMKGKEQGASGNQQANPAPSAQHLSPDTDIARLLATAVQQAQSLSDRRAESYALGTLGHLYEQTQQRNEARSLTQQALTLAQEIDAPDIAYQWQWQLGRLLKAQGDRGEFSALPSSPTPSSPYEAAIGAYTEAFNTLQSLRSDLVAINPDVQFSFRESVEPVYRQFVELLLQSPQGSTPSQKNLKQAREVIESLQLVELDNFFREACLNAQPVQVDRIDPQAAVIYPIILPNQLAVILSLPNQSLSYHQTALPQAEVERILDKMQQSLRETSFPEERLPIAQQVYDLLLRAAAAELAASDVKTLVFVLDGVLRNLPMAALHDGQQYLVEKYSIALAPSLQLLQPQPLQRQQFKGLLAGLSQARQGFSALPNVAFEVDQIKSRLSAQVLLDQMFTSTTFQDQIDSTPFPIVHLATHGQFSSNAEDTFILTWDSRITVKQLDQVLEARVGELSPIELLVLSACETATGDKRAALGMAGVAVRSGARSTLASLWSVSDRSTASLIVEFYQALGQPRVTKAQALRLAQLALLKQPKYENPYYWAPFVLLGNWL